MKYLKLILSFCLALVLLVPPLQSALTRPAALAVPTFTIVSVAVDQTVTIETRNFPANLTFVARMGPIGTRAINGTQVGNFNSGNGGTFRKTFNIPNNLKGSRQIAIRADSTSGGFFAYNWFYNDTSGTGPTKTPGPSPTPGPTQIPGYSGIPTFNIIGVARNQTVTVRTNNLPPGKSWVVRMGPIGTRAINGYRIETFASTGGGALERTFDIPSALAGSAQVSIRMDATTGGWFAFNWFYNNNYGAGPTSTPGPSPTPGPTRTPGPTSIPGYTGIPTFSIVSVVRDNKVTIRTKNFPANMDFTVRMGAMGTRGVNGIVVKTINSGAGGSFEDTYTIPAALKGSSQISIRLESNSGYFAYNWFYNSTYP